MVSVSDSRYFAKYCENCYKMLPPLAAVLQTRDTQRHDTACCSAAQCALISSRYYLHIYRYYLHVYRYCRYGEGIGIFIWTTFGPLLLHWVL